MKKTQLLDSIRNIRKELVAFLSIMVIGLLAAVAFLGITYTAAALKKDAIQFFNDNGLWDAEITSTMLMTEEDLDAIRAVPGVGEAERVWQTNARLQIGDSTESVLAISVPEKISTPVLVEGRLPESAEECAIEKKLADDYGLAVGQSIQLECNQVLEMDPLVQTAFRITGIFNTPDHLSYMVPVTPYAMVQEAAFNREGFENAFTQVRIRVKDAPENRYSDAYWEAVNPVVSALEALGEERAPLRTAQIRSRFEAQIRDAEAQIEAARAEIEEARKMIADGWRDLGAAETALEPVPVELDRVAGQLSQAELMLLQVVDYLKSLGVRLSDSPNVMDQLKDLQKVLDNASTFLDRIGAAGILPQETVDELKKAGVDLQKMSVADVLRKLEELEEDAEIKYGIRDLREKLELARTGIDAYELARNNYYYAGEEYLDALTRIQNGRRKLEDGERQLEEAEQKIREAEEELRKAKERLEQFEKCRWFVLDNKANPGFVYGEANANKLASLSMSFSTIFLVVGALVIYATIARMVEQQRKMVGVNKAMGLFKREILAKYLLFGCGAVLLGVGLGVLLAWLPMQRALLNSYEAYLNYGSGPRSFLPLETGLVVVGALAISLLAVYLACSQLLSQSALALMQGATQNTSRLHGSRSSAAKNLYLKIILRNMQNDRARVLVTIVSIAGGCVLMVVGFTLRYGISGVPDRQFGGVQTYDAEVYYNAASNPDAEAEIARVLDEAGMQHTVLRRETAAYEMDGTMSALTLITADNGQLDTFFKLADIRSGRPLTLPESGALIPRRFSEHYHVDAGGSVPVYDSTMIRNELGVAGVFENYYGQLFFLTPAAYEEAFGTQAEKNCFYVKTGGVSVTDLQKKLDGIEGVSRVLDANADRKMIEQFTSSLNFVVYLMLFIAGLMACFIVANFTMTFIQRKTGELTVMRINGFTVGECIRYLALDLVFTTILGTAAGLVAGGFMGNRILRVTETPYIQMIREPRLEAFLFAALITIGFSVITNSVALRRVRRLKLTDISQ